MMRIRTSLLLIAVFFLSAGWLAAACLPGLYAHPREEVKSAAQALTDAMVELGQRVTSADEIMSKLGLAAGLSLQNGIYVTDSMLIEDFAPVSSGMLEQNANALLSFTSRLTDWHSDLQRRGEDVRRKPVYFMLAPTASDVKASQLPADAYTVDQKRLISSVYYQSGLPGTPVLNVVRAYEALERVSSEYIYYRTDSALTGIGGYCLYTNIASAMRLTPQSLGRFNVTHVNHDYRGNLSDRVYSSHIRSDLISAYSFADEDCRYQVIHYGPEGRRRYNSLFPQHMRQIGGQTDVVLGGISPRVDIRTSSDLRESLLILADDTVKSYISFLAVHFKRITILDIDSLDQSIAQDVALMEYDRILIGLSLDTYAHTDKLARALDLLYYRVPYLSASAGTPGGEVA